MNLKKPIIYIITQECGLLVFGFLPELPWQLGAEFFMQHLYDGDLSNTLGWRWVAGFKHKENII